MINEEFQRIVLEELKKLNEKVSNLEIGQQNLEKGQRNLEVGQQNLEKGQRNLEVGQQNLEKGQYNLEVGQQNLEKGQYNLEMGQQNLEKRQKNLEVGQKEIRKDLKAVIEQTADLTEFKEEVNKKLDTLSEENKALKEIVGRHEVDIRRLKSKII